jgi:hypothetical protein
MPVDAIQSALRLTRMGSSSPGNMRLDQTIAGANRRRIQKNIRRPANVVAGTLRTETGVNAID